MPRKKKNEVEGTDVEATEVEGTEAAETVKAPKAPKADVIYKHTGNEPNKDVKLAPQAKCILAIIEEAGEIKRSDLIEAMEGVVQTKQPQARILSYYQNLLVQTGSVEMIEEAAAE